MIGFHSYTTKLMCNLTDRQALHVLKICTELDIEFIYMCDNVQLPMDNHIFWLRHDDGNGLFYLLQAIENRGVSLGVSMYIFIDRVNIIIL